MSLRAPAIHRRYEWKARAYAPVTYVRRVLLGRDPYWRRYFWNRWGYVQTGHGLPASTAPRIWVEGYGGEITQAPTVCRLLRDVVADAQLAVSTNNRFSFEFASRALPEAFVFDTPWDLDAPMKRALARVRPSAIVFIDSVKYPVLTRLAAEAGIPVVLLNGFLRKGWKDHRFMRRSIDMGAYRHLTAVAARSPEDAELLTEIGVPANRIMVTGNLRFDPESVRLSPDERAALLAKLGWAPNDPVFVAGGVRLKEYIAVVAAYLFALREVPNLKLLIAPSFDNHAKLGRLEALLGDGVARWSDVMAGRRTGHTRAVIIDTFGDLPRLYGLGTVAFVGSLVYGTAGLGHNLVEPLLHGVPTLVGPYVGRWEDLVDQLRHIWHGVQCLHEDGLALNLRTLLCSPRLAVELSRHIVQLAEEQAGAVARTREFLQRSLPLWISSEAVRS